MRIINKLNKGLAVLPSAKSALTSLVGTSTQNIVIKGSRRASLITKTLGRVADFSKYT